MEFKSGLGYGYGATWQERRQLLIYWINQRGVHTDNLLKYLSVWVYVRVRACVSVRGIEIYVRW